MWSKSPAQTVVYCREIRSASNHARGGKPMRVTSASASRSSAVRPAYMSPLPPGSTASTICGNLSRRTRMACACTPRFAGMLIGVPWMYGTAPSHTPRVFSMHAIVRYPPPLPPNT